MRNLPPPGLNLTDCLEILDEGCQNPNCTDPRCNDEIYLHSKCHPGGGVDAAIFRGDDRVHILCHVCRKLVVHIKISQ